jgi:hypothetical protein
MPSDVELYEEAKAAIAAAFAWINVMPPGDGMPGTGHLAEAQKALAQARRHLDEWLAEGDPVQGLHER